jgi:hypothetical protein
VALETGTDVSLSGANTNRVISGERPVMLPGFSTRRGAERYSRRRFPAKVEIV